MNYIKQLNAFYKLIQSEPLSSNSQCLYNFLLNKCSELGWKSEFTISNLIVCGLTNMSISALQRARNSLVQKNFIKYKKGVSNNAGTYTIIELVVQNEGQFEQQNEQQTAQQTKQQTDSKPNTLNKLKETKENKTKVEKEKNKKETDFDKIISDKISNEDLKNTVYDFIKMRQAIKKPLTNKGLELMLKKLYTLSANVEEQVEILNNSIMNNWQGIYALNKDLKGTRDKGKFDDFKELWKEAKAKDEQAGNGSNNNTFGW